MNFFELEKIDFKQITFSVLLFVAWEFNIVQSSAIEVLPQILKGAIFV